jgi:surface protein
MAIQSAQAKIYTYFETAVFGLRILSTDIFETTGSTPTSTATFTLFPTKIMRLSPALNWASATGITGNLSNTYTGSLANDNKIRLTSTTSLNLRIPTTISIDLSKVTFPVIPLQTFTISLSEDFFTEEFNNLMPSPAIASLTTITAPNRPIITGHNPFNGQTDYRDNTKLILAVNVQDIPNALTRGAGFFRLYQNGVLRTSINVLDGSKVSISGNKITLNVLGLIDAGKSYYVLIDNGVIASVDGFLSQAVTSTSQIAFSTPASTDVQFPDLVSLKVAAANLLVPQSEIMIYFNASMSSSVTMVSTAERLRIGTGTTQVVASVISNPAKNVLSILTPTIVSSLTATGNVTKRPVSNMISTSSVNASYIRIRNESFPVATFTLSAPKLEMLVTRGANLTAVSSMTAIGGSPMTLEWNIISTVEFWSTGYGNIARNTARTINIPVRGNYNLTIVWGDGTTTTHTGYSQYGTNISKAYANTGVRTVQIFGELDGFGVAFDPEMPEGNTVPSSGEYRESMIQGMNMLTKVLSWGDLAPTTLERAFSGGIRLTQVPSRLPSTVTDCRWMFDQCVIFNHSNVVQWNTANVTNMRGMFSQTNAFNQPIGVWNVSNVTDMSHMFDNGAAPNGTFNQNLNAWNVSNVTNIDYMFQYQPNYNQSMNSWNTSNVTSMRGVFMFCYSFNGNITSWDTSNVTKMWRMFLAAQSFNQNIGGWNTASVGPDFGMEWSDEYFTAGYRYSGMGNMFAAASAFNQDISGWCVQQIPTVPTNAAGRGADTFSSATTTFWPLNKRPQWGAVCS